MPVQVNVGDERRTIAERGCIIRTLVGSGLHGLALEGADDRDEMGVYIEPPEFVVGLERFEHFVYRTQPEGVRSRAGDLDVVLYCLRKYARLALAGNPTVLLVLFAPPECISVSTPLGLRLQGMAPALISRQASEKFLGYLRAQRERLVGERGQMRVWRPDLVRRYGYDTKYAMHMLRLGHQGKELLETGHITLPMPEPTRSHLLDVRQGQLPLSDVLREAEELEAALKDLQSTSPLPAEPDRAEVNRFLAEAYRAAWAW